jgi:hypothetical protein
MLPSLAPSRFDEPWAPALEDAVAAGVVLRLNTAMGEKHCATPGVSPGAANALGLSRASHERRRPHAAHATCGVLISLAVCGSAHAAELDVRGPEGCSDREELAFRVSRALGGPLESVPDLGFVVNVSASKGGFEALLNITDEEHPGPPSERRIAESDCPQLLDALSMVMVLAIHQVQGAVPASDDAELAKEQSIPQGDRTAVSTAAVPPDGSGEAGAPSSRVELEPALSAWVVADVGALPKPGLGLALSIELTSGRLRLQGSGTLFMEQHAAIEGGGLPAPGADLGLALGSLSGCYAPGGSWQRGLVFGACLRAEAGRLSGRGTDVRDARAEGRWWVAPGVDVLSSWSFQPALRLNAQAGATVPLLRTQFSLGELGDLYRPAAVTFRAALGLGVVFE